MTPGTTISHFTFLAGDLMDMGDCSTGVIDMAMGQKLGGEAAQAVYEIGISKINLLIKGLVGETILDQLSRQGRGVQGNS